MCVQLSSFGEFEGFCFFIIFFARVETCSACLRSDYYGYYTLKSEALEGESIGVEMTIDMLDDALCTLSNYVINL